MAKNYLTQAEINKLKVDLMSKKYRANKNSTKNKASNNSHSGFSSISSQFYKMRNEEIGIEFEENIRNILELHYGWKKFSLNKSFLYCEIQFEKKIELITNNEDKEITINSKKITFRINKKKSIEINSEGFNKKIKEQKPCKIKIFETEFFIGDVRDLEHDGIFDIFDFSKLNYDEISIISTNVGNILEKQKEYNKVVIEAKLNKNKVQDMLEQLLRDKRIIGKLINEKILYLGIINSKSANMEELMKFKNENSNFNFIILGIKDSLFGDRNVKRSYDWKEIRENRKLRKQVNKVKKDIKIFKKEVKAVKEDIKKLNEKIDNLINFIKADIQLLRKKRKRKSK